MIEGSEIFQMIEKDSQTDRQVITETNYIISELKDYINIYAENIQKCPNCGGNIIKDDRVHYGQPWKDSFYKYCCEECGYIKE